jgi:hypothetical protein
VVNWWRHLSIAQRIVLDEGEKKIKNARKEEKKNLK